jgi:hypothetical protein
MRYLEAEETGRSRIARNAVYSGLSEANINYTRQIPGAASGL